MIDLFEIIKDNNLIGNYSIEDLTDLLNNHSTGNYSIQLVSKNRIIIKDNTTNTLGKLECVHNYFDLGITDCNVIKEQLGCGQSGNCKNCFKNCIEQLQQGQLSKK
jgi:hypothetical protein